MNSNYNAFNYKSHHQDLLNDRSQASIKNEHDMIMIAKNCGTYIFMGNLGPSLGKIHCSSKQFKPFVPSRIWLLPEMGVLEGHLSLLLSLKNDSSGTWFSLKKLFGQLTF
jgi:hypothetical protein